MLILLYLDMFELKYKNMFAGEIYLEMTYFINVSSIRVFVLSFVLNKTTGCSTDTKEGSETHELDGLRRYRSSPSR